MTNSISNDAISILNLYKTAFMIKDNKSIVVYESGLYKDLESNLEIAEDNIYYDSRADKYYEYQTKNTVIEKKCFDIFTFTDITKFQKKIESGLKDNMTNLPNRNRIEKECEDCEEKETIFVLCDLDDFKIINDTFGHHTGDYVLKKVGAIFKKHIMENNFVGRYGGEEFLMMFYTSNLEEVIKILDIIRKDIAEDIHLSSDSKYKVHFSSGIARYNGNISIDEAIKQADKALYYVKKHGKNSNAIYNIETSEYQII